MKQKLINFLFNNRDLILLLTFGGLILSIYWQAVNFDFLNLDDNLYVYENPFVLVGLTKESIYWAFSSFYASNWHPLTWLSHQLDVSLFGLNPGLHHATNIILHLINTFLAFVVFQKLTGSVWKSFFVAALFAVHPAHVESVAWISERKDLLSTAFWFLTMFLYIQFLQTNAEADQAESEESHSNAVALTAKQKIALTVVFALGLMSKPMLVTLPFVLLLIDYWPLNRLNSVADFKFLFLEKVPLFILSVVSGVVTVLAQGAGGAVNTLEAVPMLLRFSNALVSYIKYIGMFFYPVNLGVWYPYEKNLPAWQIIGAFTLLGAITFTCFKLRENYRYLLTGWLWFVGTLVPVIGLIQVGDQALADRYTYVPYFGLLVIAVWGIRDILKLLKLNPMYAAMPGAAAIIVLSLLCFGQVSYWRNNELLFTHSISITNGNYLLMQNLCQDLIYQKRLNEAESLCRSALKAKPGYAEAYNSLGSIQISRAEYDAAEASFRKAVESNPNLGMFKVNLAVALSGAGKPEEAEENLKAASSAVSINEQKAVWVSAINDLAVAYLNKKNYAKAEENFARVLAITPDNASVRRAMAVMMIEQKKYEKAQQQFEFLVRQNPNDVETLVLFARLLAENKKFDEAITYLEKAISLKPDMPGLKEQIEKLKTASKKAE